MLASQSMSIKQIAYDLGFEQETYFTKYFKKETGLTPKEFKLSLP
ncbi:MAG: helix-turn-helix domain-containing protein [Bacteroidota bacterium]